MAWPGIYCDKRASSVEMMRDMNIEWVKNSRDYITAMLCVQDGAHAESHKDKGFGVLFTGTDITDKESSRGREIRRYDTGVLQRDNTHILQFTFWSEFPPYCTQVYTNLQAMFINAVCTESSRQRGCSRHGGRL
jgi:hypothetical protein